MAFSRIITVSTPIAVDPGTAFATIIDLPGYNTWLLQSDAFKGTTEISDDPIKVGTQYIEKSPNGTRYGQVTALDQVQRHVRFHQPMKTWPEFLGLAIDVIVDMKVVDSQKGGCVIEREVVLGFPWVMGPLVGTISTQFETEVWRIMQALKAHLEA